MSATEALAILEPAATRVRDPRSGRSMWLAQMIRGPSLDEQKLEFSIAFTATHTADDRARMKEALLRNIAAVGWGGELVCHEISVPAPGKGPPTARSGGKPKVRGMAGKGMQPHGGPITKQKLEGVSHIIAVASGKGGVGKSTIATNLAVALAREGRSVGLMDADIYGPSLPMMMDVRGRPVADKQSKILPLERYSVRCMSIGFLVDDREPIIWRGPMVMGVVRQFLQDVRWGALDVLVIDLPPGTGDAQLTLIQAVDLTGALIVTTPQDVAVLDAVRGVEMFLKLDVPVLGVVENMAWLDLPGGGRMHPFGEGGGQRTAESYSVPLLAQIPLEPGIRAGGDAGRPAALSDGPTGETFRGMARAVAQSLSI